MGFGGVSYTRPCFIPIHMLNHSILKGNIIHSLFGESWKYTFLRTLKLIGQLPLLYSSVTCDFYSSTKRKT